MSYLSGDSQVAQPETRHGLRRFLNISPQVAIVSVVALVLLFAVLFLARMVILQVQETDRLLAYNYYDEQRVMFQLDHEMLKLLAIFAQPIEAFEAEAAQTQVGLVDSRLYVLNLPYVQQALPPELLEKARSIQKQWNAFKPQIQNWITDPTNADLQAEIRKTTREIELQATETEVLYQQTHALAVFQFVRANQLLLLAFGGGALALLLFVMIVAVIFYRYARQSKEAEAAREANRLKDQFLAVMSHELRTPLNAIIGFLGVMKMMGKLDTQATHMADRARANAERLLALINDILDISKIESGQYELIPSSIDLRKTVERWQSQMEILAKQKGVEFTVKIDNQLPDMIYVDEDALTKVTTNLLANAFKFTEKGSVTLDLKRHGSSAWTISVTDTGIGIPENARALVFESFRQVDGSIRRAYGGTGLGLSIVQRLCTVMKGSVQLQSTVGEGSTFIVQLPLESVPVAAVEKDAKPKVENAIPAWTE